MLYLLHSTYWMSVENTTTKKSWWCISSTVHDRFQEWRQDGVFKRMWIDGLKIYDKKVGINWKWQSMDGAITKAPLGGKKSTGPNPTDRRSKSGTKRSLLVDGQGIPLGITVDGWC